MTKKDLRNAICEALKIEYKINDEEISLVLEKYLMMNGKFSFSGSTRKTLKLCVDDKFGILDNIAYSLGLRLK